MALPEDIYNWTRQALAVSSDDVPDASLTLFAQSEQAQLGVDYPCILTGGVLNLGGNDLLSYSEAAGYRVAARLFISPAAKDIAAKLLQLKVAAVTETYGDGQRDFVKECFQQAAQAMRRVACVIAGGDPTALTVFDLNGRRRTEGVPSLNTQRAALDLAFGRGNNGFEEVEDLFDEVGEFDASELE